MSLSKQAPTDLNIICNCELCVCVCNEKTGVTECPPCYIKIIQNHIKDCMIGVHPNCLSPDEIEELISEWKPYATHGLREIEWENYWDSLVYDGIACHSGDIYSWLQLFGAPMPKTLKNPNMCVGYWDEYNWFALRRVYEIISVSDIGSKMKTAAKEGREILINIKKENMKKKYKSLINHVLYNKNQTQRYDASNVMLNQLISYLI